jgi:hypothetical protein
MVWVGVRCRGIALPDIMKAMRIWLGERRYEPTAFDYVFSGSGTLVRMQFKEEAEAAEFAQAFAGFVSPDRPSVERSESVEVNKPSTERPSLGS